MTRKTIVTLVLLAALGALAALPLAALSQPVPAGADRTISIDPVAIDTYTIRWDSRTLSSTVGDHTVTVVPSGPLKNADASPAGMITGKTVSGSDLNLTISPNSGCGSSGCRKGNSYQMTVQITDSNGNRPVLNLLVKVQRELLQG